MKLLKLNKHWYALSDEDVLSEDFYIHFGVSVNDGPYQTVNFCHNGIHKASEEHWLSLKNPEYGRDTLFVDGMYASDCKKIIGSTEELGNVLVLDRNQEFDYEGSIFTLNGLDPYCDDDIERMSMYEFPEIKSTELREGWKKGFTDCLEKNASKKFTLEEVKYIATRFAHQCRMNHPVTNNETLNLWKEWAPTTFLSPQILWDLNLIIKENKLTIISIK